MDNNADLKLALDEMRFLMEKQFESSDTIDKKANNLINVATLTLTIIPAIKIASADRMPGLIFIAVVFVVGILYLTLFWFILKVHQPQVYTTALAPKLDEIKRVILDRPERDGMYSLLVGYINQINANYRTNEAKSASLTTGHIIWLIMTGLLVVSFFLN